MTSAQFLSRDPAVSTTRSPYGYVSGNPLNGTDPLGLWGWNPLDDVAQAASDAASTASTAASDVGSLCIRNPFGGDNDNGGLPHDT